MKIERTQWIGSHGKAWQRVGLAFRIYGYLPPHARATGGEYVANLVSEYAAHLSENQTLALIEYGLRHSLAFLENEALASDLRLSTIEELGEIYQDMYGERR